MTQRSPRALTLRFRGKPENESLVTEAAPDITSSKKSCLMRSGTQKLFKILAPGNSLRKRTAYSLALVRLILAPVIFLAVYYLFRMSWIGDRIVNVDAPAAALAQQASIEISEARRAGLNFLLPRDEEYLATNRESIDKTQRIFDHIRRLEPDEQDPIQHASEALNSYRQRFAAAAHASNSPDKPLRTVCGLSSEPMKRT